MKRKYLIGAVGLLAIAVAIPAIAQSAVTSQTIKSAVTPTKLSKSKKTPTPASIRVDTDSSWDSYGPAPNPTPAAVTADIDFDSDMIFNTKPVKTCPASKLSGTTTEQAIAACSTAKVGAGSANLNGIIGPLTGVVTAFNGAPVGGKPQILLHTRVANPPLTTVLVGTLEKSPLGKPYGSRLHVVIPAAQLGGGLEVITHFDTTVNKKFTITKKVKGKKTKVKSGYVTATCTDKILNTSSVFSFGSVSSGFAPTSSKTATTSQPCKQLKAKK
jgi:hypothetical protein